jgi:predicted phage terminase large subunit-like protein
MQWSIVYKKAVNPDGTAWFEKRLSLHQLEIKRRTQGSYMFANQFLNEIIPAEEQRFRPEWWRTYEKLPSGDLITVAMIDPAASEGPKSDYYGVTVVSADCEQDWYVRYAEQTKINPTEAIELLFRLHDEYSPMVIGVESVAFQNLLIHFAYEEMKRRGINISVIPVKLPSDKTKETRILSLVPRFEFAHIFTKPHMTALQDQLRDFPRGEHDDILDSLASVGGIIQYPEKERPKNEDPSPADPGYESWFIRQLANRQKQPRNF